jgi:hypothetical protein
VKLPLCPILPLHPPIGFGVVEVPLRPLRPKLPLVLVVVVLAEHQRALVHLQRCEETKEAGVDNNASTLHVCTQLYTTVHNCTRCNVVNGSVFHLSRHARMGYVQRCIALCVWRYRCHLGELAWERPFVYPRVAPNAPDASHLGAEGGLLAAELLLVRLQGCSVRKGELETTNHSVFLIKSVSSSPFLTEPPCMGKRGRVTIYHSKQWTKEAAAGASFSMGKRGRVTIYHSKQWTKEAAAGDSFSMGKWGRVAIYHSKQWTEEAAAGASFSMGKRGRVTISHSK